MRKVSFSLLVFSVVGVAACVAAPRFSWAGDGAAPNDGAAANQALMLHPRPLIKHAGAKRAVSQRISAAVRAQVMSRRRIAALTDPAATQPDIAVPPPASPEKKAAPTTSNATGQGTTAKTVPEAVAKHKAVEQASLPREVRQFCTNTASAAANARIAWQAARLTELATKLRRRIAEFEAKRAEYEDWLRRHDDAMKVAKDDIVAIYSRMRPDAAAAQLSVMDEVMAASLLTKLNSRVASAILAEMDPGRAARITNAMLGPINAFGGKKS